VNALTEHAPAMLAAVLIALTYYVVRTRARAAHEAVMARRQEARQLLVRRARAVDRFVDSPDAREA
jgi:hypothetical protein